jgi:hypothetical protein
VSLKIDLSFSVYYRVIPTPSEYAQSEGSLPTVYRKFIVSNQELRDGASITESEGLSTTVNFQANSEHTGILEEASLQVQKSLNDSIAAATKKHAKNTSDFLGDDGHEVDEYLSEREDYDDDEFLEEVETDSIGGDSQWMPTPKIDVEMRLLEPLSDSTATTAESGSALVRVDITNKSENDADFSELDLATYETGLALRGVEGTGFETMTFDEVPEGYRYDSSVPGQGHNCTAEKTDDENGIKSETVPIYKQDYFHHRKFSGDANPSFEALSEDPLPVLRAIRQELTTYRDGTWQTRLEDAKAEASDPENDPTVNEIQHDINEFQREIDRFNRGVSLLENDEAALELFEQVNQVFLRKVRKGDPNDETAELEYPGWRPFQIVFIVSLLPDIISEERDMDDSEHSRDIADLLYFPTGGGKTEAYLALIVFTALFDRRRGKEFGISTMMRFPLRLLTLQQFQRVVEIMIHADEVRKTAGYGGDPLSAGFFTGNTKNSVKGLLEAEFDGWYPSYPQDSEILETNKKKLQEFAKRWNQVDGHDLQQLSRGDYRTVEQCPLCKSDIELVFDTESARIEHRCSADADVCDRGKLNVNVTDIDIYRGVPTILVGTQDKLAAIGYNYRFRTLAGYVTHRCPEHGYTHSGDECQLGRFCGRDEPETRGDEGGLEPVNPYDVVPTLSLQDELHLVNEDLGTFESHYYAAYEQHLEWASESRGLGFSEPKKIAATATIEESDNQIKHLYGGKDAIRFPAKGPDYRESAYTTIDKSRTQRYYIGVTPWNRSQINSVVRLLELHQRRIQTWLSAPSESLKKFDFDELSDPDEFEKLLSHYYTLVTYVISKFEGGRVYKSAETQVNDNLTSDGLDPVERFDMQGNTDPDDMADMLKRFEQVGEENGTTHEDLEGLITATSSISHGVDIDALGYMLFFNAPCLVERNTAWG